MFNVFACMTVPVSERPCFSKGARLAVSGVTIPKLKAIKKSFCFINKNVLGAGFAKLAIKRLVPFAASVPKTVRQVQERLLGVNIPYKRYTTKFKKTLHFTVKKAALLFRAASV